MIAPQPPKVSVIVPAYGVAHFVGETLQSLLDQRFDDWEAVIVDDGAPDDVAGAVAPFLHDPRFRLLQTDNGGLSVARNRAIAAAHGEVIALLDGDDRYEPDYLAVMSRALLADPANGFATCDATYFGASRVGERFSAHQPQELPISLDRVLRREFNVYGAAMIRREALESVGGFDAALRSAEDFDLWIRLIGAGWRGAYVPQPLACYRRRAGSLSADTSKLLRAVIMVYANAEARLAGRPEAATAREMREDAARALACAEGEAMVLAGDERGGMRRLREGAPWLKSRKWYLMMPLLSVPGLARPVLAARARRNRRA